MSTYDKIAWLPLCGGLTGLGLVLSWLVMRRRGLRSGLRGVAWSLLPMAAYLTGAVKMFWRMGVAIGDFAKGFAFSAQVWAGIAVAGLAVVLLVVSGGVRRRRPVRAKQGEETGSVAAGRAGAVTAAGPAASVPAVSAPQVPKRAGRSRSADAGAPDAGDDDLREVEEILRRRGIS